MKCQKCGATLEDGVLFCRECGAKVEASAPRKRFCRECGAENEESAKFCTNCGANLSLVDSFNAEAVSSRQNDDNTTKKDSTVQPVTNTVHRDHLESHSQKESNTTPTKKQSSTLWNRLDLFMKIALIAIAVLAVFLLVAVFAKKTFGIIFSVIQIGGLIVAVLMHKGIIKQSKEWLKWIVMGASVVLIVLNVMSYSWGKTSTATVSRDQESPAIEKSLETAVPATNYTIKKGTQYAFMSDEANVYIANAISNSIITVECWGRNLLTEKSVKHSYDIGTFKINDPAIGFSWVDEEQTAFTFLLQDGKNSHTKKQQSVIFTINVNDSDEFKGTDYNEDIICYIYRNDDWNIYRAIPLTNKLIKIENWGRSNSSKGYDFIYNYDLYIIDENNTDTDFEWTDEERTSFTITLEDPENKSYIKEPKFVAFTIENNGYIYNDVLSYLNNSPRISESIVDPSSEKETAQSNAQDDNSGEHASTCKLFIEVDFEENLMFSKYNAELYLDDQYIDTLAHGKYYTTTVNVKPGKHKLSFKEENGSNRGNAEFTVTRDSTFTCKIQTTSYSIDVSNESLTESVRDASVTMPNTVGMLYSEALEVLKKAGLINISYNTVGDHFIWVDSNWLVQGQNVEPGTSITKSEDIKLECISLEDYWKETYIGKNVGEIQKLAEEKGFTVMFQDQSEKSLDTMIESMDSKAKEDWVATAARQYTFTGSTVVVTVEFTGEPTPTPIPTNTPVPSATTSASSDADKNTPKATSTPKATKKPSSADYHSSNNREIAKKGNSGVYAYRNRGKNYDLYFIIDFDEGYVYYFTEGNGDESCDKVAITSGDLNSYVLITYHDGGTTWQEALHFNYKNMPDTLIFEDSDHFEYKYSSTNLDNALKLRNKKKIVNY